MRKQFNRLHDNQQQHPQNISTKQNLSHSQIHEQHQHQNYYDNSHAHENNVNMLDFLTSNKFIFFIILVSLFVVVWSWRMEFKHFRQNIVIPGNLQQIKNNKQKQEKVNQNEKLQQKSIQNKLPNLNPKQKQNNPQLQLPIIQKINQNQNNVTNILKLTKSPQQLQNIIKNMQNPSNRPSTIRNVKKSTHKQNQVYFAYTLSQQQNNTNYLQAQYYYYNKIYNINNQFNQLPLCAVIVGRNLGTNYNIMLDSILQQNYTNYHIIWIDDHSNDKTTDSIEQYINNKKIDNKINLIKQKQRKYALFNRNLAIRNHCKTDEIILDLDADDYLIGRQVFKVINKLYQDQQLWACYFNNIIYSQVCKCPLMNGDTMISDQILNNNVYRTSKLWRTTELRTFKKQLFDKINQQDFVDSSGQFYRWKSDAFINYAIVELTGSKHIKFLDQFFYFYNTSFSVASTEKSYCRLSAKSQIPYLPLQNLKDKAKKMQNYTPPQQITKDLLAIKNKIGK